MNKIKFIIISLLLVLIISFAIIHVKKINKVEAELNNKIVGSPVYAMVVKEGMLYDNYENGRKMDVLELTSKVEILKDRTSKWYFVDTGNKKGWVKSVCLKIPKDLPTNTNKLTKEEIENYINKSDFSSATNQFVWVDIDRQLIYILEGSKNNWSNFKTIVCSTGKNISPTTRGTFTISDRGRWFYSDRLESGAVNWVRFNGSYLFHSVAMDKDKNVIDGVLGVKRSSGCVRMDINDSKWFYDNINYGTQVFIN